MKTICIDIESNHTELYCPTWKMEGLAFTDGTEEGTVYTKDPEEILDLLESVKQDLWVGHNLKFDLNGLLIAGYIDSYDDIAIADTMIGLNLVDENEKKLGLKYSVKKHFGYKMVEFVEANPLHGLPLLEPAIPEEDKIKFAQYAKDDVRQTLRLWQEVVKPRLEEDGVLDVFWLYMDGTKYIADMERNGIRWKHNEELVQAYKKKAHDAEMRVYPHIGYDVSLRSPKLGTRLFDDLRLPKKEVELTEKGAYRVDNKILTTLSEKYPFCKDILEYRNSSKMINTYLAPFQEVCEKSVDGRIHPSFWQTTYTGRKRSSNPNMQNVPVVFGPLSIRQCICAREGSKLLVADLSQAQLRIIADISGDVMMRKAYTTWQCGLCDSDGHSSVLHTACPNCGAESDARTISNKPEHKGFKGFYHGLDVHQQTADLAKTSRKIGKNCNFAMSFGATPWKLHKEYGGPLREWERVQKSFFNAYTGIKDWHERVERQIREQYYVADPWGRRRRYEKDVIDRAASSSYKRADFLNQAVNAPIQAAEAHAMMAIARNFKNELRELGLWGDGVWLVAEVHDEFVLECEEALVDEVSELILHHMRYSLDMAVPMDADISICDTWDEGK